MTNVVLGFFFLGLVFGLMAASLLSLRLSKHEACRPPKRIRKTKWSQTRWSK